MVLHWGIVSSGKISNDFVNAVSTLPSSDHKVVAIGARSLYSAQNFAKTHGIPKAYEGYEKLARDSQIDVIYIGNLNPQHYEVSKMMLEHGKHVLCEKPLTLNNKQAKSLIQIAKAKKLFLMEAIWSRFFPVYGELRKILKNGDIGDILHLNVSFGFNLQNIERLTLNELGGGTILDLGIYVLQFQQIIFGGKDPIKTHTTGGLNKNGVDTWINTLWTYEDNKSSFLATSALAEFPNEAVIVGTKGIIRIPQFWCPTKIITPEKTLEFELPKTEAKFEFHNSVGLAYEAEHVRNCIASGLLESPLITHKETLQLANQMTELRTALGVSFPEDNVDY